MKNTPAVRPTVLMFCLSVLVVASILLFNLLRHHPEPEVVLTHTLVRAPQDIVQPISEEVATPATSSNDVSPIRVTVGISAQVDSEQQFARPSTNATSTGQVKPDWFIKKQQDAEKNK